MNEVTVGFLWHMHQPYYKDPLTGCFLMPWVRLHAIRGYYDMIAVLDDFPKIKSTFNLVPSLIAQLVDYTENNQTDTDFILSGKMPSDMTLNEKRQILERFFSCNQSTMITPFTKYEELLKKKAGKRSNEVVGEFSNQDILDLQVLFNLTWIGFTGRKDTGILELIRKGRNFSESDKIYVLNHHMLIMKDVLNLYKRAKEKSQIEISISPFYHPISPLVINTGHALRCMETRLPEGGFSHPEDLEVQIKRALELYGRVFGGKPEGLWPSEGSVCPEMVSMLEANGLKWAATDEDILFLSLREQRTGSRLYRPYQVNDGDASVSMFFRDRTLSDMIGFVYSKNPPEAAARDFIYHVEDIRKGARTYPFSPFIPVILDGENPWEYYPDGGEKFLRTLFTEISGSAHIRTDTFSSFLKENPPQAKIDKLYTGSWINHNFSIWIGHEEDRKAWEYLAKTRKYVASKGQDAHPLSWEEIYIAEGSDWFWWFGDEFMILNKGDFDNLFRLHLRNCYELNGDAPPPYLFNSIITPYEIAAQKEPSGFIRPVIDGRVTNFYEWRRSGVYLVRPETSSMYRHSGNIFKVFYGFDEENLYLRIDFGVLPGGSAIKICFVLPEEKSICVVPDKNEVLVSGDSSAKGEMALMENLEIKIGFEALGFTPGQKTRFYVVLEVSGMEIERHPASGLLALEVPDRCFERKIWHV